MGGERVRLEVIGPFRLLSAGGRDCAPKGRKACALLAFLALSPGFRCSRQAVQNILWGSRGREQAAGSLRQCLVEIRRALGPEAALLVSDNTMVALDADHFECNLHTAGSGPASLRTTAEHLLDGLDIREKAFSNWIRDKRREWAETHGAPAGPPAEAPSAMPAAQPEGRRDNLVILTGTNPGDNLTLADCMLDAVARTISELSGAQVIDSRAHPSQSGFPVQDKGQMLELCAMPNANGAAARLVLREAHSSQLVWSTLVEPQSDRGIGDPECVRGINQTALAATDRLLHPAQADSMNLVPQALCLKGIRHLFRLGHANFLMADAYFKSAFEREPRGIYLAWRGYLRTFLLVERRPSCRKTISEEAYSFMRQALEIDPLNSYVHALGAHVHSIIGRSYVAAYESAERSIEINPANPIGWATLGIAKCYLGQSRDGYQNTLHARGISGSAPFRYQLDTLSCIAGSMAGKLEQAIHFAEASLALAPEFVAPLRYLSALYIHSGQDERANDAFQRLRAVEPDFSYEKLRESDYPAAGLRTTGILDHLPMRNP